MNSSDTSSEQSLPEKNEQGTPIIHVCHGRMCGRSAKFMMDRIEQVKAKGVAIDARSCTCFGLCAKAPNVKYKGKLYSNMNPISVSNLIKGK